MQEIKSISTPRYFMKIFLQRDVRDILTGYCVNFVNNNEIFQIELSTCKKWY